VAALIQDLKQRGMLDSTMVVWGGEFGRTPLGDFRNAEEAKAGRDNHASCFTMWAAGGGIRGGVTIGKTDELGMNVVEDPVHVNDLQATILHCLGFDHTRLTYRHMGRDFRLTDVRGEVVRKMLA
jgi:arylsulfatase A-like enzyme